MVQIAGKYEKTQSIGVIEFLKARGVPEERIKAEDEEKTLEIKVNGDDIELKNERYTFSVTNGKETEVKTPKGEIFKNTAKIDGNVLAVTTVWPNGKTSNREYRFSDSGLELIMKGSDGTEAKQIYKRL